MIQIDDAGNGAVLGGEVIGALRVETGEYAHRLLPLSAYDFFEIPRIYAAKDAVISLLHELNHCPDEEIHFCTGDIFKEIKSHLTEEGVAWREEKIVGALQELVEASFFNSLRAYGLPEKFRAFHHDYQRFHNLVFSWVCQDLPRRSAFCKPLRLNSGLISRSKIFKTIIPRSYNCGLCGEALHAYSIAIVDKHEEQPVYYHPDCFPAEVDLNDFLEAPFAGETLRSFTHKAPTPVQCAICGQKLKYKKRVISYQDKLCHLNCFSHNIFENKTF